MLCLGLHPSTEPLLPQALSTPKPVPASFQEATKTSRFYTHKQGFEEAQFLKENKALTRFTPFEGEKRLDLLFLLGVCTHKDAQDAIPDMGRVIRGPGTDHRCLHRQNEGRTKSSLGDSVLLFFILTVLEIKKCHLWRKGIPKLPVFLEAKLFQESSQIRKRIQKSRLICLI